MADLPEPTYDRNDPAINEPYTGSVYVLSATGGFTMERQFDTIKRAEQTEPDHIDVTDAVQIKLDVSIFNNMLDLSSYDTVTDSFGTDSVTLTAEQLTANLTNGANVISVGKYATLYSDFQSYVAKYFGFDGPGMGGNGFETLFIAASEFKIDTDNHFDGDSFVALLSSVAETPEGAHISELSGSITISNIAKLLKYSVDANVFGNRDPASKDWGIADGFVPGDLIWVPGGTTITLKLNIDPEAFNPLNNNGPSNINTLNVNQTTSYSTGDNFSLVTEASTTLITRTATAPLLIKLVLV
jgi:hypothetical protein